MFPEWVLPSVVLLIADASACYIVWSSPALSCVAQLSCLLRADPKACVGLGFCLLCWVGLLGFACRTAKGTKDEWENGDKEERKATRTEGEKKQGRNQDVRNRKRMNISLLVFYHVFCERKIGVSLDPPPRALCVPYVKSAIWAVFLLTVRSKDFSF